MKTTLRGLCIAAASVLASGCGPTNQQAINQNKPQFAQLRAKLASIAGKLPPAGSVQGMSKPGPLSPPVVFATKAQPGNTETLMFDHLLDPDVNLDVDSKFDLHLSRDLLPALHWTGDKNPMSSSIMGNRDTISGTLTTALAMRYLVVVRTVEHARPEAVTETTYAGGKVALEIFLVDLESETAIGSFTVQAEPPASVTGVEMKSSAHGAMWGSARTEVAKGLEQLTGGPYPLQ